MTNERRARLRKFLRQEAQRVLEVICFKDLDHMLSVYEQRVKVSGELINLPQLQDSLNLLPQEVHGVLQRIFNSMQELQRLREDGTEVLTILRRVQSHLEMLRKALNALVLSEDFEPKLFPHLSERKRFLEVLNTDLGAYEEVLSGMKQRITLQLESVIPSRTNVLMRAESAIRLLCKVNEPETWLNKRQSGNHTSVPQGARTGDLDTGTFHVESVT